MSSGPAVTTAPHPDLPGHEAVTLASDGLTATFVPTVGMVGCSLRDGGVELLGQRGGIRDYLERGKTFGLPLLAPWANRLSGLGYAAAGADVRIDPATPGVRLDAAGLPIHGLFAASPLWVVGRAGAEEGAAVLSAAHDHGPGSPSWPAFPFAHRLALVVRLSGRVLAVTARLEATGDRSVPVAFGFHPYLAPPDAPRAEWVVALPSTRRAELDDRGLPTGDVLDDPSLAGMLGARTFDALLADVAEGAEAVLVAGARRLALRYGPGFGWSQVWAPADPVVFCPEPMTAPVDPFSGFTPVRTADPGAGPVVASFEVHVPPVGSAA